MPRKTIAKTTSQLSRIRFAYQDDTNAGSKQARFKPFVLTDKGIEYLGIVIPISKADIDRGYANTIYGMFAFDLNRYNQSDWITRLIVEEWERQNIKAPEGLIFDSFTRTAQACAVLGLTYPFTLPQLKEAYRSKSKETHPDTGGDHDRFIAVQEAYEFLKETVGE